MMVQLLIMGFVIFASSRNFTMIGTLTLGINPGLCVGDRPGAVMSVDKGQMEPDGPPGSRRPRPCSTSFGLRLLGA